MNANKHKQKSISIYIRNETTTNKQKKYVNNYLLISIYFHIFLRDEFLVGAIK